MIICLKIAVITIFLYLHDKNYKLVSVVRLNLSDTNWGRKSQKSLVSYAAARRFWQKKKKEKKKKKKEKKKDEEEEKEKGWERRKRKRLRRKQVALASYGQRFPLPHCYSLLSRKIEVNGAAAPEGPMTYDST